MRDNLPDDKDETEDNDKAPVKVSFHSLKDDPLDDEQALEKPEPNKLPEDVSEDNPDEKEEPDDDSSENKEDPPEEGEVKEESDPLGDEEKPENSSDKPSVEQYYLQTVKVGEQPEWPRPKEDLDVFSQPLGGGLIQYWAYLKTLGKTAEDLPLAEKLANQNQSGNPVIIIDQICDHLTPGSCLELVLSRGGHALAKTESNLENLESNITSLLDLGRQNFGITAEHFMSTSNVLPEVEKRLDELEEAEGNRPQPQQKLPKITDDFKSNMEYNPNQKSVKMEESETSPYFNQRPAVTNENKRSKLLIFIPILILIIILGGVVYYREKLLSKFMNKINPPKPEVTEVVPNPTPTPTPTISIDRSQFKVRVLNGTPKTGAAGVLADKLKEKGWIIERTGNATSSAIAESYVRAKAGNDDAIKVLLIDVEDYQGVSSSSSLKPTDKADLEFVIGSK